MRKAHFALLLLLVVPLGFLIARSHAQRQVGAGSAHRVLYYVDPMHPAYKSDRPGIAPDCGMQLVAVYADEAGEPVVAAPNVPALQTTPAVVSIDSYKQQLLGIRVAAVEGSSGARTVRIAGRVTADETRVYRVNAPVDGYVWDTHADTVGSPVKSGQRLAEVYSQEYLSVMAGYVSACEQLQASTENQTAPGTRNLLGVRTSADRLRTLGMSEAQVQELCDKHKIPDNVPIVAPQSGFIVARNISAGLRFERNMEFYRIADLSHVWVIADLFGGEDQYLHPGTIARVTLINQRRSFTARVADGLPQIDPVTRAVKVRLEVNNKDLALRPDMLVDVEFALPAPSGMSVPADAVVDSGLSQRVYVDRGNGSFEPRQVEVGARYGNRIQILRGLAANEKVVNSGIFLVDSESRLRSAAE